MFYIMCFNLKDSVNEEEFVRKTKDWVSYIEGKVEELGSMKLFRHHAFGANRRTFQTHIEFKDFGTWDRFMTFHEKDAKAGRSMHDWQSLIDMDTHYDEFVREISL